VLGVEALLKLRHTLQVLRQLIGQLVIVGIRIVVVVWVEVLLPDLRPWLDAKGIPAFLFFLVLRH